MVKVAAKVGSKKVPLVSVLIGTRDRPEPLLRCLESVFRQDYRSFEILVLDDCSESRDICTFLSREISDFRLKCFRSDRQLGVAGGRNFLMRKAKGDIFVVIDDDAVFADKGCVSRAVKYLGKNPVVGILAFKIVDHCADEEGLIVPFSKRCLQRQRGIADRKQLVSYYLGGGHAIRRSVIEQCGYYQDDLGFGDEELDLSYRVVQAGIKILYVPDNVVHHYPEPSVLGGGVKGSRSELYFRVRNRIWLAYKYLPFPFLAVHLFARLGVYSVDALKNRQVKDFLQGIGSAVSGLRKLPRTSLDGAAVKYLKKHFGRLWY